MARSTSAVRIGSARRDTNLQALADVALRRAAVAARPDAAVDDEVRALIRRVCAAAHHGGVRVEELIVLVKEDWWALPQGRHLTRKDASDMLACVVTACIEEYFSLPEVR